MTIQATTSASATGTAAPAVAAAAGSDAADRFLTLLVTQLKNQDPLNPLDNAQLTSQLAQINTVTGINKLNDTVASLAASITAGQSLQAVGLVGHTVVVPGNKVELVADKGGTVAFALPATADGVTLTIKDAAGATVRTLKLPAQPAGTNQFTWDGKTDGGATAAEGIYTFEVAATAGGTALTAQALMAGKVVGLASGANGMQLDLGRLGRFDLAQVIQLS
jgi:flagellar basal-body rod modification protein FlgD